MSIKRTTLLALPLLVVSSIVIASDNPFARWDQLNRATAPAAPIQQPEFSAAKTATAPVAAAAPTTRQASTQQTRTPLAKPLSSLEYFSASAAEAKAVAEPAEAVPQTPAARPPVLNAAAKTKVRPVQMPGGLPRMEGQRLPARQPEIQDSAGHVHMERLQVKTQTAQTAPTMQPALQNVLPPVPPAAEDMAAVVENSNVGRVSLGVFNTSDPAENNIRQTSAAFDEPDTAGNANPFADFLASDEPIQADPEPPAFATASAKTEPEFGAASFGEPSSFDQSVGFDQNRFTSSAPANPPVTTDYETVRSNSQNGPQTPTVTLRWQHQGDFNVGQECRCDLLVENTGSASVRNVVAEAVLPDGLEVISAVPAPMASGGSATWSFGELKPGQGKKIELVVIPRRQGNVEMTAFVRMTGASSTSFTVQEPSVALKLEGPASIEVGQLVNYTVNVTNPGTGMARNVMIQAVVPDGLEHKRGKMLTIDIGTLNPGESRRARLSLTGTQGGDQKLAVRVVADGGLTDQTIETVAVAEPQLNIGVRGPAQCVASQPNNYEVIVVNEGKVDSNNVRAKYRVPNGFDFVSADRGGKFDAQENTIDWFVGTLEPGQLKHFNVSLRPSDSGEFKHQVGVISEHGKMTMAEHLSKVQGHAKLALTLASNTQRASAAGGEASFEIRIQNVGNTLAEGVGVSCEVPPGLELVDISGPSEYLTDSGVIIFRALPSLQAGESAAFIVRTKCNRPGQHVARVRVASKSISKALIDEETVTGVSR